MIGHGNSLPRRSKGIVLISGVLTTLIVLAQGYVGGQPAAGPKALRIGISATLMECVAGAETRLAVGTLRALITDETGLNNEILLQKDWRDLANKMAKGEVQIGVFLGHEFAWTQKEQPDFKPLALAVNVNCYPVGCVVVHRDSPATDLAGLQGKTLSIPRISPPCLRLFVERECHSAGGKTACGFFGTMTVPESVEDALDDVVDGDPNATVVDRAALDAFKRRKPGRFNKLKVVAQSQPFPPPVVAYYGNVLDEATRTQFQKGLLEAGGKARNEIILALMHLTGFETPPEDFAQVLAQTRRDYPAPNEAAK